MKLTAHLVALFLLLSLPALVNGQTLSNDVSRGGTVYSSIGLGQPIDSYSPFSDGMGLTGVGLIDPYAANVVNPASWGVLSNSLGALKAGFETLNMRDNNGSSLRNRLKVEHFQIAFPLLRSRLGFSLAFAPVTNTNYSLITSSTFQPEPDSEREPIDVIDSIEGSGGINKFDFGLGYRLGSHIAVGYTGSVYFSSIKREVDTIFGSGNFSDINYTDEISGTAFGNRFGIFGRLPAPFLENDEIMTGATLTLPVNIDTDRKVLSYRAINNQLQAVEIFEGNGYGAGTVELPLEFNAGLTYYPHRWLGFSTEYLQQKWSEARISYITDSGQYYTDRTRLAFGAQFLPYIRNNLATGLFNSLKYSAGISFDSGHLTIDDQKIETLMFHAGLGALSGNPRSTSSVDVSFKFGFRGTKAQNLVRETIWGVSLSLNLSEFMFQQIRFN